MKPELEFKEELPVSTASNRN